MNRLLHQLTGGDLRSLGAVPAVLRQVRADPGLFPVLLSGLTAPDPRVRLRCADALEKLTAGRPDLLAPHRARLLRLAATARQQEVRWHLAQMLPRLRLGPAARRRVVTLLQTYLADDSRIVKTCAMQALADLAARDPELRAPVVRRLAFLTRTGSPAMRSRGRRLLAHLRSLVPAGRGRPQPRGPEPRTTGSGRASAAQQQV